MSRIGQWSEAHLLFASLDRLDPARTARLVAMARAAWRNRGFGDFWAHMLVAQGSAEAMIEDDLQPWDLAAGGLVATEAGAVVTGLRGEPASEALVVAAAPGLVEPLAALLTDLAADELVDG